MFERTRDKKVVRPSWWGLVRVSEAAGVDGVMGCDERGLLHSSNGEIVDRGLDFPDWFALSNEPVNLLKGCLLNPDLSTGRADLGRHILEEVKVVRGVATDKGLYSS